MEKFRAAYDYTQSHVPLAGNRVEAVVMPGMPSADLSCHGPATRALQRLGGLKPPPPRTGDDGSKRALPVECDIRREVYKDTYIHTYMDGVRRTSRANVPGKSELQIGEIGYRPLRAGEGLEGRF